MGLYDLKPHPVDSLAERDSFGRFRVSQPQTLFDSKLLVDNQPLFWDDQQTSGSGTSSTYSSTNVSVTLAVGNTTAGTRVRQTFRRFNYQPGKSQLIFTTFNLGAGAAGITKRIGYFDANNGLFLESLNGATYFVVRKNAADLRVAKAEWNLDVMDGSGHSGITLDLTKAQIFVIDFEWLGVGTVRYGFVIDGVIYYAHIQKNANQITTTYSANPNLPIRYEISNSGTGPAASMECICSSVNAEAGYEAVGTVRTVDRDVTGITTNNDANIYSILGIRLKSTHLMATVFLENATLIATGSTIYRYMMLLNPTVAGAALVWTPVTNSALEFTLPVVGNTLTGGTLLGSGYQITTATVKSTVVAQLPNFLTIGSSIAGVSDTIFIAIQRITGADTYYASMTVRELL